MPKQIDGEEFFEKAKAIRLVAMDVDGTLTDGVITILSDGREAKNFNVRDGFGIVRAQREGLVIAWVSGRYSEVTNIRAEELGISHIIQGKLDKLSAVRQLAGELSISLGETAFIGDDTIDAEIMNNVGLGVAVADSDPMLLESSEWVTSAAGGKGAVRELLDQITLAQSKAT